HVAHEEFRFNYDPPEVEDCPHSRLTDPVTSDLPRSIMKACDQLRELIAKELVDTLFQPIVDMDSLKPLGYEALGRGAHLELGASPRDLFFLAEHCHLAGELSRAFRLAAAKQVPYLPDGAKVFLNMHPTEVEEPGLIHHLRHVRSIFRPSQK